MSDYCEKHNFTHGPEGCSRCEREKGRSARSAAKELTKVQPLRFSCLSLAVTSCGGEPHTVLGYAQQFYDFVTDQELLTGDDSAEAPEQTDEEKSPEENQYLDKDPLPGEEEKSVYDGHTNFAGDRAQPRAGRKKDIRDYGAGG